jgi:hypothetical protein
MNEQDYVEETLKALSSYGVGAGDAVGEVAGLLPWAISKGAGYFANEASNKPQVARGLNAIADSSKDVARYFQNNATANVISDMFRLFGAGEYGDRVAKQIGQSTDEYKGLNTLGEWGIPAVMAGKILNTARSVYTVPNLAGGKSNHYRLRSPETNRMIKVNGKKKLVEKILGPHVVGPAAALTAKEVIPNSYVIE